MPAADPRPFADPPAAARPALAGLTRRGVGLLAAGGAAVVAGITSGVVDLSRVGVLLLALPLVALASVGRTRYRVACARTVEPPRVATGEPSRVTLRLENVSRLPTAVLLAEDELPAALGGRPRFTLDRLEAGGARSATYQVVSGQRGRFPLGPLTVRLTDPFGLCELRRSFSARDELVVTPVVESLPPVRLGGEWTGGGSARSRAVASSGEDDIATRAYRQGDDLRRVHWRSTARAGELMVRREEQPWQSRGAVLLDCRAGAHRGDGTTSSFEAAVSGAASAGVHLARRGYTVRLLRDDGVEAAAGSAGLVEGLLLESLAVVRPSRGSSLRPALARLHGGGREGLVVAVCGALDSDETAALARARGSGTGIAVLLDVASWSSSGPGGGHSRRAGTAGVEHSADQLGVAGWRVVLMRAGEPLAPAWSAAAGPVGAASYPGVAATAGGGQRKGVR